MGTLKKVWKLWTSIGKRIATLQSKILLLIFYYFFLLPLGLVVRTFTDNLKIKKRHQVGWGDWNIKNETISKARKQS